MNVPRKLATRLVIAGTLACGASHPAGAAEPAGALAAPATLAEGHRGFFRDYCVECHGPKKQEGMLRLDDISLVIRTVAEADRWQKILNQLNSGEMPPADAEQPDRARKTELLDGLSGALQRARKVLGDEGGRITLRRLNRREYRNTIRELLDVEVDVGDLPADGGIGGFDTAGASLFMSSDQIERYLALARRALDDHVARRAIDAAKPYRAREEAEVFANRRMDGALKRTTEMHAAHARWAEAVDKAADLPENRELAARLREAAKQPRPSSGVPHATPLMFYHDWAQLRGAPPPTEFGFKDAQDAFFEELQYQKHHRYYVDYQTLPGRDTGAWLLFYQAYRETYVSAGPKWPPGRYTLRMRVAPNPAAPGERRFVEVGQRGEEASDFTVFGACRVTGTLDQPQVIEFAVDVAADGKREFAVREKRPNSRNAEIRSYYDEFDKTGHGPVPAVWIDWFEIEGPLPPRATAATLVAPSPDRAGARTVIERFAERAFRGRKPAAEYVERLLGLYEARRAAGDSFDEALLEPLGVVLASPSFLYLREPAGERGPRRLDGLELAARLSYFLWSAPPDDELLESARTGKLVEPEVLARQVDRLLADERSRRFAADFTHQWLGLDRLDFFQFDFRLHRAFDDGTKIAAREEVYRTFDHLLRENQGLDRLLKADFVIVDATLANYYGLDGVAGDEFRKVPLAADSPRGGLLGMAAILAMGGNGRYTSPVERGAWVLRKLLHDPPPPAPPNVPQLARLEGKLLDVRERLRLHQEEPQCANCHRKIDPVGFGLENFDAAGKWRTVDTYQVGAGKPKTWPIDPSAAFHNGPSFRSYFELRDLVAARSDDFARGFTEALIEYALGRPFGFTDEELASEIVARAKGRNWAMREFVRTLVASETFRSK